ncbi:MAG: hypothetical protein KKB30_15160 [Proteobacteria bacterium]|nr:hypothetical protein [Pseudomonadota bacterium]MBU1716263.1 hypothetical protein [Pseudomonadota bacterium]
MNKSFTDRTIKNMKSWYFLLRNDPEALVQTRTLVMGIIACLVIYYGGNSVLINPKQKILIKQQTHRQELIASTSGQVSPDLTPVIQKLNSKKMAIQEEIAVLINQEGFLREQWEILSDPERFNKIIFTMSSSAPVSISENLDQMTLGETRSIDEFEIHPSTLTGDGDFQDFLAYLQYLENRPEAENIDNLTLEGLPGDNTSKPAKIHFSIMISRIKLKKPT